MFISKMNSSIRLLADHYLKVSCKAVKKYLIVNIKRTQKITYTQCIRVDKGLPDNAVTGDKK